MKNKFVHDDYAALPAQAINEEHHPVAFLLDNSLSMGGAPLKHLIKAVNECISELKADEKASRAVEICMISFNDGPELISNWRPAKECNPIEFGTGGTTTNLTAALREGVDKLRERGHYYDDQDISCFVPFLILVTDGYGGDVSEIAREILSLEAAKKIRLFILAVPGYDEGTVKALRPDAQRVLLLDGKEDAKGYRQFFKWLAVSFKAVSNRDPNKAPEIPNPFVPDGNLNPPDIGEWFKG